MDIGKPIGLNFELSPVKFAHLNLKLQIKENLEPLTALNTVTLGRAKIRDFFLAEELELASLLTNNVDIDAKVAPLLAVHQFKWATLFHAAAIVMT